MREYSSGEIAIAPKQISWYDHCSHELNAQARLDRVIFLCEQFEVSHPSEELCHLLEQVPAPVPLEDWAGQRWAEDAIAGLEHTSIEEKRMALYWLGVEVRV